MSTQSDPRTYRRVTLPNLLFDEAPVEEAPAFADLSVVACSLCLRVLRDGVWVDAEEAIRDLRSYDRPQPLALEAGVCDGCSDGIRARRAA